VGQDKASILIVEDDLDVAEMLNAYFRVQGYDVMTVNWGEDGIRSCETNQPDLIILDIRLPDIDGYEVAQRLRSKRRTKNTPIIFLTEKRERTDRLHGLELGADDYITKPFDIQELRLRVRNALRRDIQGSLANAITLLPTGRIVDERLSELLDKDNWALLLISVENLDSFRDTFGFVASDDVLRAVSTLIQSVLREIGTSKDFLGHFTTKSFVVITKPHASPSLRNRIGSRLKGSLEYFYPLRDLGNQELIPSERLAIRIGELLAEHGPFSGIDQLKNQIRQSWSSFPSIN
jgi:DNA-binding response OmpR family regulator